MTPRPAQLPSALDDVFRVGVARSLGVPASRLRAGDLRAPFWGIRTAAARDLDEGRDAMARQRVLDFVPRLAPGWFFVRQSAALLWRIPVPLDPAEPVHIGVAAPGRLPRGAGIRGHKVVPALVAMRRLDGIPVASPASTWAQLGGVLSVRDLVAAGCAVIRVPRTETGRPGDPSSALATMTQLQAQIAAGRRIGINKLREALPLLRPGISSRPEAHLMLDLDDGILPRPDLDHEVRNDAGVLLGISEIAYPGHRVAVEYEGDHHRTDKGQWNRDIEKQRAYAAAGWTMVRLTSDNLYGTGVSPRALVRQALWNAGWRTSRGAAQVPASVHPPH